MIRGLGNPLLPEHAAGQRTGTSMSYHLTILRTKGARSLPITEAEFAAAVAAVPELVGGPAARQAEYRRDGKVRAILRWRDGEIWTAVAEPDVIAVMLQLAERLGARVRGDECETYRTPEESYLHPDDRAEAERAGALSRSMQRATRRRQWVAHACIFGTFALLALVVAQCSRR
jgi:hypothetical protein